MESFKLWLEGNADIHYIGSGKYAGQAWVTFAIRGKRYEYAVDPLFTETDLIRPRRGQKLPPSHEFRFYIQKGWYGKAHNVAKKHGTLLEPKPQPAPKPAPVNWPEDWELENRKQQARMQGDHVPF